MSAAPEPGIAPPIAHGEAAAAAEEEQPWLRLDRRMLLVHPVDEIVKLLPVLLISLVIGTQSGNHVWSLVAIVVFVVFGVSRWFTTSYRIGPVHVQLRQGLFRKRLLSVPRNRIRSVDVEAGVLHRLLGLSIVRIGTGQQVGSKPDAAKFELNALSTGLVPGLRTALLARQPLPDVEKTAVTQEPAVTEIGHWTPAWVRYAPFSVTGVVTIAAIVGLAFQYGIGAKIARSSTVAEGIESAERVGIAIAVVVGILILLIAASALACIRYLLTYGNMTLTDNGRTLHVSHGLLKTRQTTLDRARLRGTTLKEPLLLRLAGGARLDAVMTGVSAERRESSLLLPQAPRAEAERVMATVISDHRQAAVPLTPHGPVAQRRRYTRALIPAEIALAVALVFVILDRPVFWAAWAAIVALAVGGVVLAWDRYRGLGHAVLPGWLITRSGSLDRARDSLEADGIIGWTVRQTFFQRRAGVATVIAATPAGTGKYLVIDLPADQAWSLVESVTPGGGDVWARR
ncbi:PH domain-containing protein [Rhodococcus sp. WB9]|uniref:PH domain-containing protein n=1 Tax=Rhodococcus sp. WB9 TaxID=2594007 RepID=UPI001186BCC8|nr:PH domain-containing protein [Rhodococcus sp. WB9]QDQ91472.1 PH domain-containing protein [Rhodococcus sp. WB9]